ncbi:hypothetical protein P43SY_004643 [Pythium insidiosum]|uniref:TBC1 domain family member 7 n=1 Tax=Pythium insidiosum TaxID=114742 RepID=A0AAD5Q3G7_PYTIN|nr:hypothetical protein P43SY_004643 [Pythium insidiosum]
MALNRNFRTTYYKTLGVPVVQHIVDVEASYHALFAEPVINVPQLVKLAAEVGISPTYRATAWKVLCGVLPPHKCLWEFAAGERQRMYDDVAEAAHVLGVSPSRCGSPDGYADCLPAPDHHSPTARSLMELYRVYEREIQGQRAYRYFAGNESFLAGVIAVLQTVLTASPVDQFWCLTRIVT